MDRSLRRRAVGALAAAVCLTTLTGCAPQALGFEHDDTIRQGYTAANGRAWGGVDVENVTDHAITLESLGLTGLSNARISSTRVIPLIHDGEIGFFPTDLTPAMRTEFTSARPLRGFTLPAHSHDAFEVVFLVIAVDPSRDATTRAAVVTYSDGGTTWSETRHSGFCLAVERFKGCAA